MLTNKHGHFSSANCYASWSLTVLSNKISTSVISSAKYNTNSRFILNLVCILFFLTTMGNVVFAQTLHPTNSKSKPTLFQKNGTKTEIKFQKKLSDGTNGLGSFTYETIDVSNIKVTYDFERTTVVDPYKIRFSYFLTKNVDESYSMDMAAALAPMEMRMGNAVKMDYIGDKIHYPKELKIGQSLPDAKGIFELSIPEINVITNELTVSNRKVVREEMVGIEGKQKVAIVISFEVESTKKIGELLIMESKETVEEWLVSGLGIVNQVRSKKVHHCTMNCEKKGLENHPSEKEYLMVKSIHINQ